MASQAITLREATPDDADLIRAITRAAYARWVPVIGRDPLPMRADYDAALRDHPIELLLCGHDVAGLLEYMIRPDHLWIENIAVLPAHQGKGLGQRLLAHAEKTALAHGLDEVRLLTNAAFESNVRIYEKAGFQITRREPFLEGTTLYLARTFRAVPD